MVGAEKQMRLGWFCPSWVPSTSLLLLVAVKEKKKKNTYQGLEMRLEPLLTLFKLVCCGGCGCKIHIV